MERREAYPTDTQHIVNLSGYVWAADQLGDLGRTRVLDIACGAGFGSDYLAGRAHMVVGIDLSCEDIAGCRLKYPSSRIAFLPMDGAALGFRSEAFDAIVSHDTIEHVQDDHRFVSELSRVLCKGGVLVLTTAHGKERGRTPEDPYHLREYTPEELKDLLSDHFKSIRWYGRRQGARLMAVEGNMDTVRRWDPIGLRRLVPRWVRHRIGSLVSLAQGGVALGHLGPEDIHYVEGIWDDTNLIAVCVK